VAPPPRRERLGYLKRRYETCLTIDSFNILDVRTIAANWAVSTLLRRLGHVESNDNGPACSAGLPAAGLGRTRLGSQWGYRVALSEIDPTC